MHPSRLRRCGIVLKPSTLLHFHHVLTKRKYRMLFSAKRGRRPGPKGPAQEWIDARLVKKLDPIENAGHRQNGPNWVRTTLSAGFHADVTSCYVKFRQTFLGPSAHPATIIEFKQIEFFYLTASLNS